MRPAGSGVRREEQRNNNAANLTARVDFMRDFDTIPVTLTDAKKSWGYLPTSPWELGSHLTDTTKPRSSGVQVGYGNKTDFFPTILAPRFHIATLSRHLRNEQTPLCNGHLNRNDQRFEALLGLESLLVGRNMLIERREVIYLFVFETYFLQE